MASKTMPKTLKIGALFAGYGGLELALNKVFGNTQPAWFSEINKPAIKVFNYRWPGVPNLGDITQINWEQVERPHILTGGFPCQDVSAAGARRGLIPGVTRTGLWAEMAKAINILRPDLVIAENVKGLRNAKAKTQKTRILSAAPLVKFSTTWPPSGIARHGTAYQL